MWPPRVLRIYLPNKHPYYLINKQFEVRKREKSKQYIDKCLLNMKATEQGYTELNISLQFKCQYKPFITVSNHCGQIRLIKTIFFRQRHRSATTQKRFTLHSLGD